MTQPPKAVADTGEHFGRAVAVLHIDGVDDRPDQKVLGTQTVYAQFTPRIRESQADLIH